MSEATFGERIRELRRRRRWSQLQLGVRVGVEHSVVGWWEQERHKPSFSTLLRLSEAFRISLDELMTGRRSQW